MLYKVEKEEGVEIDGEKFKKGALVELEEGQFNSEELIKDGSIVLSDEEDNDDSDLDDEFEDGEKTGLYFDHMEIVGPVKEEEVNGVKVKVFTNVNGVTFKLTPEEYAEKVSSNK